MIAHRLEAPLFQIAHSLSPFLGRVSRKLAGNAISFALANRHCEGHRPEAIQSGHRCACRPDALDCRVVFGSSQ